MRFDDIVVTRAPHAECLAMLVSGRTDMAMLGAPQHLQALKFGFGELVKLRDLFDFVQLTEKSKELRLVWRDGLTTTIDYWENNHDTALRFCSVLYRILKFMKTNEDEALGIHIQFTNSLAGTTLDMADGKAIYHTLDPFYTFEEQFPWFFDKSSPWYYEYIQKAWISEFEETGALPAGKFGVDDVIVCHRVFFKLVGYRMQTNQLLEMATSLAQKMESGGLDSTQVKALSSTAQQYYDWYDYLDSYRFADAAVKLAEYSLAAKG